MTPASQAWWRRAVVYQVYIRSFADGDGDGIGDIAGIRSRLPYLRDLGVDALWITPWYPSPMADGGYDVADYRGVDPLFGSIEDADALVREAHAHGLRVILDIVPNHTSSAHPWFVEALAAGPGSAARGRYVFRDGRGADGGEPPTGWGSVFGGGAWTRVTEADGRPGQWYLHMFAPEQPDFEWANPEVRAEFEDVLRTWFDRGVDGFRIDVANGLVKDHANPEPPPPEPGVPGYIVAGDPLSDQEGVHEIYRAWRRVAEAYAPPRILLGEVHASSPARVARYLRPDELHGAFNFHFLRSPWDAGRLRAVIDETLASHAAVGAAPTWVLSNHDETRHVTRYGRPFTGTRERSLDDGQPVDEAIGTRRARAAALLLLALPGGAYVYQGEELGLPEVEDLPEAALRDPIWRRSGHAIRGRDGCRVPLPWSGTAPPFGFGPPGSTPWLPQPASWAARSVEAQAGDPGSMLALYRRALALRNTHPGLSGGAFAWLPSPDGVLLFERDDGLRCAVNLSGTPVALPGTRTTLLRSDAIDPGAAGGPGDPDALPADAAAWYLER
ncbi:MAG: glycoside hydrolase family 13 protein [Chloroflexota bacterium]